MVVHSVFFSASEDVRASGQAPVGKVIPSLGGTSRLNTNFGSNYTTRAETVSQRDIRRRFL